MTELLVGLDVGLSAVKAIVVDPDGAVLSTSVEPCPGQTRMAGRCERDMDELWSACERTLRACVRAVAGRGTISAVAVAGHGDGLYLADADGRAVRPAMTSLDVRGGEILRRWADEGRLDELRRVCGQAPWIASPLVLCAWLREREPDALRRTRWVLSCKDWIRLRLTGRAATDATDASQWLTAATGAYGPDVLTAAGLEQLADRLAPLLPSAAIAGEVTPDAAARTGLPCGTPVICGCHDVQASAIGTGATAPGMLLLIAGTFAVSQTVSVADRPDPRWRTRPFVVDGLRLHNILSATATVSLDWFLAELCAPFVDHEWVEAEARRAGPGAQEIHFHPYLHGDPGNPGAAGAFIGLRASHRRADMLRAVLDATVCSVRMQVEQLAAGFALDGRTRLAGGAAHSPLWSQLFADGLRREIEIVASEHPGAHGAALLAGVGAGVWPDLDAAVTRSVRIARTYRPDSEAAAACERKYEVFGRLGAALAALGAPGSGSGVSGES